MGPGSGRRSASWDYPRSRGDDDLRFLDGQGLRGLSPLARGRLSEEGGHPRDLWTIPARAGTTVPMAVAISTMVDYPRSRGDDVVDVPVASEVPGLSPLARGRRSVACHADHGARTIPARAGTTPMPKRSNLARTDYPRSRGDDVRSATSACANVGLSPLARGRPEMAKPLVNPRRTIPARAGTTWP